MTNISEKYWESTGIVVVKCSERDRIVPESHSKVHNLVDDVQTMLPPSALCWANFTKYLANMTLRSLWGVTFWHFYPKWLLLTLDFVTLVLSIYYCNQYDSLLFRFNVYLRVHQAYGNYLWSLLSFYLLLLDYCLIHLACLLYLLPFLLPILIIIEILS